MSVNDLKKDLSMMSGHKQVYVSSDFSPGDLITYCVIQGENILAIGSGEGKRLKTLMGNKGTHNNAPIVGLCSRIYSDPIEFYLCCYTQSDLKRCSVEERNLQASYGETNIDGVKGYKLAMQYLRNKLEIKEESIQSILLDLMETHGDILNHALNTKSTAQVVYDLFGGYWNKGRNTI